ncbi:MAG: polysaccharide deacetylase family protein [Capsulimonadaceae bacterium]
MLTPSAAGTASAPTSGTPVLPAYGVDPDNVPLPVASWHQMAALAHAEFAREKPIRMTCIARGNERRRLVALTFDDGPHAIYTMKLLAVLRATHTPATFFVIGKQVDRYPYLVQQEALNGDEIGNHTFDHVNLNMIPPDLIGYELDECNRSIQRAIGVSARFFRPPGGDCDSDVYREAGKRGYITTLWTDDPADYARPGADIVLQRSLDRLRNGAIVLLHDGIQQTIDVLPAFIEEARKRGYTFVTISQLARDSGGSPSARVAHATLASDTAR